MKRYLVLISLSLLISGCSGPSIHFEQPQPIKSKDLISIPQSLHGKYFSQEDSTYLEISPNFLKKTITIQFSESLYSIKSELKEFGLTEKDVEKDTTINFMDDGLKGELQVIGDSARIRIWGDNIIFELSENTLIRENDGIYFLNKKKPDLNQWEFYTLERTDEGISLNESPAKIGLNTLRNTTTVDSLLNNDQEVTEYILSPDLEELKEIIKLSKNSTVAYKKVN